MCGCNKNKSLKAAPKEIATPKSINKNQTKLSREELLSKLRSRMNLIKSTS